MISTTLDELRARARVYIESIPALASVESDAYIGGGSLAQERIASIAVAIKTEKTDGAAARLREETPPIIARIDDGRLLLDLRTIAPEEDRVVISALKKLAPTP